MTPTAKPWDYLIVTASNDAQAAAYQQQLAVRRELGLLAGVNEVLVVPDPGGKRVGSGGSTIRCIIEVLAREIVRSGVADPDWLDLLRRLRVLIVHAGGDSRRLPAYGPCGKIFIPVPGENDMAIGTTLFDRQLPAYLDMPAPDELADPERSPGQIVITAGDVLLTFDPAAVRFAPRGITGLGARSTPEQASKHGAYCVGAGGKVRLYLQKPSPDEQQRHGAIDRYGQSVLDIGVIAFDAACAVSLLKMCQVSPAADGKLAWRGPIGDAIETLGLDFYREICCALGSDASAAHHAATARASGSRWSDDMLAELFTHLGAIPCTAQVLSHCGFLHFGTTRQIIGSGAELLRQDRGTPQLGTCLSINNDILDAGVLGGSNAWVEGCRIAAPLTAAGENVIVGLDVQQPVSLPPRACIDVIPGRNRSAKPVNFIRCYGVDDTFKESLDQRATFCNIPFDRWLAAVGATPADVWDADVPASSRTLWNARVFVADADPGAYTRWLWMFNPVAATADQTCAWLSADRYSSADIALLADPLDFFTRRETIRACEAHRSLRRIFRLDSHFSAVELAHVLLRAPDPAALLRDVLAEAAWHARDNDGEASTGSFVYSRMIHSLGSAVQWLAARKQYDGPLASLLPKLAGIQSALSNLGVPDINLPSCDSTPISQWADAAHGAAFDYLGKMIVFSGPKQDHPVHKLRSDEIVWGRAPARLDLGGGWTDTPPYSLEHGGAVINAAVNLNGQPPIHCYGRIIEEPLIRITSIDLGTRLEIRELYELLDYRKATSEFGLVKAALALSGFQPELANWPGDVSLRRMLELFGGGIELTTLAAVPKGSGLGTSSIMGAVIFSVVQRMFGRRLTQRELFNGVLRLEQALTTGGGWQDQIGGVVDGVKVITTEAGLVPDARIHYVPADVLDPRANAGATLLYYTGITRLAKNILHQVVGRYLDRDRAALATLRQLHALPPHVAEAMARKDLSAFGQLINVAWRLNKQLDPNSSNDHIESMLARVQPYIHGAKLLGAGGGGFLLLVCKSSKEAAKVRWVLESDPPNDRARFFNFSINAQGLAVSVC